MADGPDKGLAEDREEEGFEVEVGLGVRLFLLYGVLVGGFVYMEGWSGKEMAATVMPLPGNREMPLFGTNLGVVCGVGLIVLGVAWVWVYMHLNERRRG